MKVYKDQLEWKFYTSGAEGNVKLFGVNIFDFDWQLKGESINLLDPIYNQKYVFDIFEVIIDGKKYEFAAGEFSACYWAFYVREE